MDLLSADELRQSARAAPRVAKENPLGLALGALAAGFVVGLMLPITEVEDERLGPASDRIKSVVRDAGDEAIESAEVVGQTALHEGTSLAEDMVETVEREARTQIDEFGRSSHERARHVRGDLEGDDMSR